MTQTVVLATSNPGKVKELADLLTEFGFHVVAQSELNVPSPEETGLTFIENALLKARHASQLTGLPAIADDSGLAVDALQGAPGIYSARYSGQEGNDVLNTQTLLKNMQDVPDTQRQAQFHCALVYLRHANDPTPILCHGVWHGEIIRHPVGSGGFGYDPVFYVPELGCTAAELSKAQKNACSHRGQALQQLLAQLRHA